MKIRVISGLKLKLIIDKLYYCFKRDMSVEKETEKESRLFLWTNRILLIGGIIGILCAIVFAFSNILEAGIFFLIAIGMFFGRSKVGVDLKHDVDNYKIPSITRCYQCEGEGKYPTKGNAWSYNLSQHKCDACDGKGY